MNIRVLCKSCKREKGWGILGKPSQIHRHWLSPEVVKNIKQFYQKDGISRLWPGKKDWNARNAEGTAKKVQKRSLLCNEQDGYLPEFDLTGHDSWFTTWFWIFTTKFFVIMSLFTRQKDRNQWNYQ